MRILLHADSLIRDPGPMLVLAGMLRRRGHNVVVSSRLATDFYLIFWRPHYLIHSAPNAVGALYERGLITEHGPRVAIIPQEGMERQDETMRAFYGGILQPGIEKCIDHMFMWNAHQFEWLRQHSKLGGDQLSVVANVRLDLAKFGGNVRPRSGVVGFLGRFPTLNKYDGSHIMRHLLADVSDRPEQVRNNRLLALNTQVASLVAYADIIHHLMRYTDYRVSLRPHHEEAADNEGFRMLKRRYGERIEIDRGLSIYDWSLGVDAIISTTSTAFAEAYLAGTPVICIDRMTASEGNIDDDEVSITESYADDLMPRDTPELLNVLKRCVEGGLRQTRNDKIDAVLSELFSWPYAGSALARVVDRVHAVRGQCSRGLPWSPKLGGDLMYFARLLRNNPFRPRLTIDKHYSRLFHGTPSFVARVIDNIAAEDTGLAKPGSTVITDSV